ncbi:tRNA pseudouridine(55) synthase TruB [Paraurantiacibacter namhicola]|uniref:tRNA pseudouridine synthase B n=1 Tax=Paraurantiacibacter namhicola TaxID=645517 RepID=A0A1C7DAJ8_9SPHN|nr:tRNA pseudouridine(55) synthase TruB [Paraurantiacibacter namhicola]ANU08468.1 tRNA pseudouridine synthase B [Paraurantiacibacter namhicola]
MNTDKPQLHGWLLLDKPRGLGSTQAVGAVKRIMRQAGHPKTKVGHGGTLDPLAQGVLPIALGEATKLAGRMLDASKIYDFTLQFGEETDTLDVEGEVVRRSDRRPPMAAIAAVLEHFTGAIEQVPPVFSAIKVDGNRAYDRARAGEDVAMEAKTRAVTIHSLSLAGGRSDEDVASVFQTTSGRPDPYDPQMPLEMADSVTLTAHVSKGTYIRSLARDIAHALGTVGHVTYLRRTKAGPFAERDAISLDKLDDLSMGAGLQDLLLPLEAGLDDIPALHLDPESAQAARQGRVVSGLPHPDGLHFAKLGNVPVALVELDGGTMKVVRGFNLSDVAE